MKSLPCRKGSHSIIKDAKTYADELGLQLQLNYTSPIVIAGGKEADAKKAQFVIRRTRNQEMQLTVSREMERKADQEEMGR